MKWRRRSTICRTLALVLTVSLCFLIVGEASTKSALRAAGPELEQRDPEAVEIEQVTLEEEARHVVVVEAKPEPLRDSVKKSQEPEQPKLTNKATVSDQSKTGDEGFMATFEATMALMPAELTKNSLLGPFMNNGEEHIYDLALRVREFRPIYEAWEKLHLIQENGELRVRNVLQSLRSLSKDAAASMHSYDTFRFFLDQLNARLFPGVVNTVRDLIALHTSFNDGGRGIVLTVGNGQVPYVMTSIQGFRKLGCELPIEIMYLGDDDLGEDSRNMLEGLPGVVTRNMKPMINDEGWALAG